MCACFFFLRAMCFLTRNVLATRLLSAAGYLVEAALYKCVIIIILRMYLSTTLRNVI